MAEQPEQWMQSAIKHHGALRAYAEKMHHMNPDGTMDHGWLQSLAGGNDIWADRARLALTLREMHKTKEGMDAAHSKDFPRPDRKPTNDELA